MISTLGTPTARRTVSFDILSAASRLLVLLVIALGAHACTSRVQWVHVVDEAGLPVPAAWVRLTMGPLYAPEFALTARTDDEGRARFVGLAEGHYSFIEATASHHWHVEWLELGWHARLPGDPIVVDVQELWVGGAHAPNQRLVTGRVESMNGFTPANHWPYREGAFRPTIEPWPTLFEEAHFAYGFKNPSGATERAELQVEWFGFEPLRVTVPLLRYSEFTGPSGVDIAELTPCPWVEIPVELLDPDGGRVPPGTTRALLAEARLFRCDDVPANRWYRLDDGERLAVPCGDYELRSGASSIRVGPLAVTSETTVLACHLPQVLRLVRVRVSGVGRGSWMIRAQAASGFYGSWIGIGEGEAEAVLPVGTCDLSLEYDPQADGMVRSERRAIEVRNVDGADLGWQPGP